MSTCCLNGLVNHSRFLLGLFLQRGGGGVAPPLEALLLGVQHLQTLLLGGLLACAYPRLLLLTVKALDCLRLFLDLKIGVLQRTVTNSRSAVICPVGDFCTSSCWHSSSAFSLLYQPPGYASWCRRYSSVSSLILLGVYKARCPLPNSVTPYIPCQFPNCLRGHRFQYDTDVPKRLVDMIKVDRILGGSLHT